MSLETILHSGLNPTRERRHDTFALVLMGGGARTAYQVGVLRALARMRALDERTPSPGEAGGGAFPFQVLVGTSAGALNSAFLASNATQGLHAFETLAAFWEQLRSDQVYRLQVSPLGRLNRWLTALQLRSHALRHGAILDTLPLADTLHRAVSLPGIEHALQTRSIEALAISASSYSSGVHWTFCQCADEAAFRPWSRPGRRALHQHITIEHLMASSAIPFIFPATPLWADGRAEFFGDGTMRQISPLSPALHLGATRVLVIGAGQPQRAALGMASPTPTSTRTGPDRPPTLGAIAGFAMASVFHDTLQADVEQTQRVTQTLRQMPAELAAAMAYRPVQVMSVTPSRSLDTLAQDHVDELPAPARRAFDGLGVLRGGGAGLVSYLLFEPGFVRSLMQLGEQDAYQQKDALMAFMAGE